MLKGIFYNRPDKYKYSLAFNSKVNPVVSADFDKYLSVASQDKFKKFLPKNIDFEKKIDFLGICGEAFVANKLNRNEDALLTEEAIAVKNLFPLSFVDAEHNRSDIIGVVVESSFAEYGTGKELTEEEVKTTKSPFSVILSGIIWRVANPDLADIIEASSDPSSEWHDKLFYSWELGFEKQNLIVIDANKTNTEDGQIISDEKEINKLEVKLKAFGGSGVTEDGKKIGRIPVGDVLPLGLGIVKNPAGQVKPITTTSASTESNTDQQDTKENDMKNNAQILSKLSGLTLEKSQELIDLTIKAFSDELLAKKSKAACPECGEETDDKIEDDMEHTCAKCGKKSMGKTWKNGKDKEMKEESKAKNEKNISQLENTDVNRTDISKNNIMKIKTIKELNDDVLKECKASDIQASMQEILDAEIKKISDDYVAKTQEKDKAIQAANDKATDLQSKYDDMTKKLNELTDNYNKMVKANQDKEKVEVFSARMETIENKFNLTEKQKDIVANKVKKFEKEEEFTEFLSEAEEFYPKKTQTTVASTTTAVTTTTDTTAQTTTVNDALKNATTTTVTPPNAATTEQTLAEKAKKAFSSEGWTTTKINRNK